MQRPHTACSSFWMAVALGATLGASVAACGAVAGESSGGPDSGSEAGAGVIPPGKVMVPEAVCPARPGCDSRTSCAEVCDGTRASAMHCQCNDGRWVCTAPSCPPIKCPNKPPVGAGSTPCNVGLHCAYGDCQADCRCVAPGKWECTQDDCVAPPTCGPTLEGCGAIGQECTSASGASCECVGPTPAIWKCSGGIEDAGSSG
ncbi:MAG: hypothetical protein IPG50_29720 [Myxococcales bacterium]|nr:hypothetical protein [Myxococcales bacterium]